MGDVRIDKWLWAVRVFKTRSIAADACKLGRVTINGAKVKPSRTIRVGETVQVRKPPVTYALRVVQLIENRVGAKLVPQYMENVTPQEQLDLIQLARLSGYQGRAKGLGRPTKKERRDLDEYTQPEYVDEFDFDLDDLDDDDIAKELPHADV